MDHIVRDLVRSIHSERLIVNFRLLPRLHQIYSIAAAQRSLVVTFLRHTHLKHDLVQLCPTSLASTAHLDVLFSSLLSFLFLLLLHSSRLTRCISRSQTHWCCWHDKLSKKTGLTRPHPWSSRSPTRLRRPTPRHPCPASSAAKRLV